MSSANKGWWLVGSDDQVYVLDLDERRLARVPGQFNQTPEGSGELDQLLAAFEARRDFWVTLRELVQCRIGSPLLTLTSGGSLGSQEWRQSGTVTVIRALPVPRSGSSDSDGPVVSVDAHELPGTGDASLFFDRDGRAIDTSTFLALSQDPAYQLVARSFVGRVEVTTTWLGVSQWFGPDQPPLIFVSQIRSKGTSPVALSDYEYLAATQFGAIRQHHRLVRSLRQAGAALTQPEEDGDMQPTI